MSFSRALVTLAIGKKYAAFWHKVAEPSWRWYAQKYDFDLICIEHPLDISRRAQDRSAAWQKCLILSQDFAQRYEQLVWLDTDMLINNRAAPDVAADVPLEKVGAVEEMLFSPRGLTILPSWPRHLRKICGTTGREYYAIWGLPNDCDAVVNTGLLVLSPRYHRELLESIYYDYEERGEGRELQMEMRPLSYELCRAGLIYWLDHRFN
ncbi:MAG: hypothetical protein C5B60_06910, partial [Chloroflexi bacterium]